ncbi:MAG: energy-coupling factor transporter transmembrane component T [Actinomycetota bacterium]
MTGIHIGGAITSERLGSTFHEGVMLATILAILAAATSLTNPHQLLRSLPVMFYEFGVAVVIATSIFPQLAVSSKRIRDAQSLRGHELKRLREWRRFALPLLEDSLSRSLELAESMDARGYGISRQRSKYRMTRWRSNEYLLIAITFSLFIFPWLLPIAAAAPLVLAPNLKELARL